MKIKVFENAVRAAKENIRFFLSDKFKSINYFATKAMFYGQHGVVEMYHS